MSTSEFGLLIDREHDFLSQLGDDSIKKGITYTHNRNGTELCGGYNDGTCSEMGAGSRCKRNNKKAHQCNICLSNTHGACDHEAMTGQKTKKRARAGRKR